VGASVPPRTRPVSLARRDRPVLRATLNRSELSHSLISQGFLPKSDTNRRSRRTLRNKRFSRASDTTRTNRAQGVGHA